MADAPLGLRRSVSKNSYLSPSSNALPYLATLVSLTSRHKVTGRAGIAPLAGREAVRGMLLQQHTPDWPERLSEVC